MSPSFRIPSFACALALGAVAWIASATPAMAANGETWRYYRPSNTGIQGDYCDALWIGPDGDPWIGGYVPAFEEGGIARFVQAENRWVNVSNVDYPAIGHPNDTGTSRVSDIVADARGVLWMGTGRGVLKFDPAVGPSSLVKYDAGNSGLPGGWTAGAEIAPDGTLWFSSYGTAWGAPGLTRFNPSTNTWTAFANYGDGTLAVQRKPATGYYVWTVNRLTGMVARFDSGTQAWTNFGQATDAPWKLAGKASTDASGNTWMERMTGPSFALTVLDCRRPDGTWVHPPLPALPGVNPPVWAFRAFGNMQALLVDGNSVTWRFDGASWTNLGQWRTGAYTEDVAMDSAGSVWVCGTGGAAKRNAATGQWQRYRVTNTSQFDYFNNDLALDDSGHLYACANAGSGIGGMVEFDGTRWTGFNNEQYGLGHPWPFPTDNSASVYVRPSTGAVAVNPTYGGVQEWTGAGFAPLQAGTTVADFSEDSMGRLWYVGEYFNLQYFDGAAWTQVGITGWGSKVVRDPERPGTVWASTGNEIKRTDGVTGFTRTVADFPELATQSDQFSGLAPGRGGIAWVGTTVQLGLGGTGGGLLRLDANNGTHTLLRYDQGWPFPGKFVTPLAVTPDGRLWMQYIDEYQTMNGGLCWYDGTNVGVYPGPTGGAPQWGGLPHTQITDLEVRSLPDAYELWMSCASRGIAVLRVPFTTPAGVGPDAAAARLDLAPGRPNPFRDATTLTFTLPAAAEASLDVFDVGGRHVRSLARGPHDAGPHDVRWNGTDEAGHAVMAGVYFAKLRTGGEERIRRIAFVR